MMPTANAPLRGGKGGSSSEYAEESEFWNRATDLGPIQRAEDLILNTDPVFRGVRVAIFSDRIMVQGGAEKIF